MAKTKLSRVLTASDYLQMSAEARAIARELRSQGLEFWVNHGTDDQFDIRFRFEGEVQEITVSFGDGNVDDALSRLRELFDDLTAPKKSSYPPPPRVDPSKHKATKGPDGLYRLSRGGIKANRDFDRERYLWLEHMRAEGVEIKKIAEIMRAHGLYATERSIWSLLQRGRGRKAGHSGYGIPRELYDAVRAASKTKRGFVPSLPPAPTPEPAPAPAPAPDPAPVHTGGVVKTSGPTPTGEFILPSAVVDRVDAALRKLIDQRLEVLLGEKV